MKRITKLLIVLAVAIPMITYGASYTLTSASYPINVNGQKTAVQPLNLNGTTYLPLRAISEAVGIPITWDNANRTVNITTLDINELKAACVMIYADDGKMQDQGSGVYIDYDQILTANHVTEGNTNIKISDGTILTLEDSDKTIDASVLDSPLQVKPVKLGDSDDVKVGDKVVIISSPSAKDDTVTYGKVSMLKPLGANEILIEANLDIGSSGGAVFDTFGNLIGIVVAGGEGKHFVIPINVIRKEL